MIRSSAVPVPSIIAVDDGALSTIEPDGGASKDASYASLVETVLSVSFQVHLFD